MQTSKELVEKIAEACNAVGGVSKQGRNQMQGYDYVRAADIAKVFRHELFKRGLVIIADEQELTSRQFVTAKGGQMNEVTLKMQYCITDGAAGMMFGAFGIAMDAGDKALWKAKTGALKYFLRGLGIVPDEKDDPEADESVDKATSGAEIRKPQALRPTDTTIVPQKRAVDAPPNGDIPFDVKPKPFQPPTSEFHEMPANDPPKPKTGRIWNQKPNCISEPQAMRIFGIGKGRGKSNDWIREFLGSHGYTETNEIPKGEIYSKICSELEIA